MRPRAVAAEAGCSVAVRASRSSALRIPVALRAFRNVAADASHRRTHQRCHGALRGRCRRRRAHEPKGNRPLRARYAPSRHRKEAG